MRGIVGAFGSNAAGMVNVGRFFSMRDRLIRGSNGVGRWERFQMLPYQAILGVVETSRWNQEPPGPTDGIVVAGRILNAPDLGQRNGESDFECVPRFMGRASLAEAAASVAMIRVRRTTGVVVAMTGSTPDRPTVYLARTSRFPELFYWRHAPTGAIYFSSRWHTIAPCVDWGTAPVELQPNMVIDLRSGGTASLS